MTAPVPIRNHGVDLTTATNQEQNRITLRCPNRPETETVYARPHPLTGYTVRTTGNTMPYRHLSNLETVLDYAALYYKNASESEQADQLAQNQEWRSVLDFRHSAAGFGTPTATAPRPNSEQPHG